LTLSQLLPLSLFLLHFLPHSIPHSPHLCLFPVSSPSLASYQDGRFERFLKADDIQKALDAVKAEGSFDHKKFFALVGLKAMTPDNVKKVFQAIDADQSGFIEEEELKFVLKSFAEAGRDLTDAETRAFLNAADKDGDGKIGIDEFEVLVHEV
uniref:parvalbumin alpha-like n=1 Tax=Oncorhynchus gorbuscha TaxID=8017 RepID=UPI001EAF27A6